MMKQLENILYREDSIIASEDVESLMSVIRAEIKIETASELLERIRCQFKGFQNDTEVNGADLVQWIDGEIEKDFNK